jgi:hypothetical protein
MVSNDDASRNEDHEGALEQECELSPYRNERGIPPDRWAESARADEDPGLLTRAGCQMRQPSGRDEEGPPEALDAMHRRVEAQAEVGRLAEESGDYSPRRLK